MTPLYDAIRAFSAQGPVRLHIPGHKGKPLPIPELTGAAALDVTELGPTGDLFHGGEPFDSAQALWAEAFGFDHCQFLRAGPLLPPRGPGAHRPGVPPGGVQRPGPAGPGPGLPPTALVGGGAADVHNFPGICGKSADRTPGNQNGLYYIAELLRIVV